MFIKLNKQNCILFFFETPDILSFSCAQPPNTQFTQNLEYSSITHTNTHSRTRRHPQTQREIDRNAPFTNEACKVHPMLCSSVGVALYQPLTVPLQPLGRLPSHRTTTRAHTDGCIFHLWCPLVAGRNSAPSPSGPVRSPPWGLWEAESKRRRRRRRPRAVCRDGH